MRGEFYKMEFDAWDEGTFELSLEEEAAYLRLCHQMYRRRGPIPNSERLLCALWRCHQNKARKLLQRLVDADKIRVTEDGHLTNTRVTREVDARETVSRHRADAGHTGGTRSGHARRKPLKSQEVVEAKRSREEEIREDKKREEEIGIADSGNPPPAQPSTDEGGGGFAQPPTPSPADPPEIPPTRNELLRENLPVQQSLVPFDEPPKPTRAKRRTRMPDDWTLPDEGWSHAAGRGLTGDRIEAEAEKFKNYHLSRGSVMADWSAAWRTWVGNAGRFSGPLNGFGRPPDKPSRADSAIQGIADCLNRIGALDE